MNQPLRTEVDREFARLLELPEPEQQPFLAREYANRPELRAELESLIRAHRAAGNFLEPTGPRTIGRYRLIRLLGEGGMGVVYEAEQEQPRRTVALKVIRAGISAPDLLWRFEQEAQALGRLQHPGIAQIYEAGTADTGFGTQPYFAMEFIQGASLVEYADAHQFDERKRLKLMAKLCDAVEHAHQRGVIHRDLKPGNILVDETGQPKILDFGIARAVDRDLDSTRQTGLGQMVGTLAYMSPEQVLADPLDLDTRSDVYALGVILYELLAARLPYSISHSLYEAMETIRENDPPPLGSIDRRYRGDVERIASKALEKDKTRRYASAAEFAADIRRYLNDEPISARAPGTVYQLYKFVCRHRMLVLGIATIFVVLLAGIIASTWEARLARRAEQKALTERDRAAAAERVTAEQRNRALSAERVATAERNRAVAAEMRAVHERNRALIEKQRADDESATAKAINDFLQTDLLAQASAASQARPGAKPNPDLKVRTALDQAAARITGKFEKQPLVEASIRQTIGTTYRELGVYSAAQSEMERALQIRRRLLGEENRDTLSTMNSLVVLYHAQGKYAEAESLCTEVLQRRRRLLGDNHPETLTSLDDLATLYAEEGKYARSEPLAIRVLALRRHVLGKDHADTLTSANNLAMLYLDQGKYLRAEPLFAEVLHSRKRVLGEEHPSTLISANNLAMVYLREDKYSQAEPLFTELLAARRRVLGKEHPDTLTTVNNLAALYMIQGRYGESEPMFDEALAIRRRALGEQHPSTLKSLKNLALLYRNEGKYEQSEQLFLKVIQLERGVLGDTHPDTQDASYELALLYYRQGTYDRAEPLLTTLSELRRHNLGPQHPETAKVCALLGKIRLKQQRFAEAEPFLREALESQRKNMPDSWERFATQSRLGASLLGQGRFAEAEPLLLTACDELLQRQTRIPAESRSAPQEAVEQIVQLYAHWELPQKAAAWQTKLAAAATVRRLP